MNTFKCTCYRRLTDGVVIVTYVCPVEAGSTLNSSIPADLLIFEPYQTVLIILEAQQQELFISPVTKKELSTIHEFKEKHGAGKNSVALVI